VTPADLVQLIEFAEKVGERDNVVLALATLIDRFNPLLWRPAPEGTLTTVHFTH
jgi:hypothetical protein